MTDEIRLLAYVSDVLTRAGIEHFVSGSVASMWYGEPRLTQDIDIVVHLRSGDVAALLTAFPEPEYYLEREAIVDAIRRDGQFNVIQVHTGMKVDFMCAEDTPYNECRFARVRRGDFVPGVEVCFSAPEDVILKKLEFFREGGSDKHLRDIASMLRISGGVLDREYLAEWAHKLRVEHELEAVKHRTGWQ